MDELEVRRNKAILRVLQYFGDNASDESARALFEALESLQVWAEIGSKITAMGYINACVSKGYMRASRVRDVRQVQGQMFYALTSKGEAHLVLLGSFFPDSTP